MEIIIFLTWLEIAVKIERFFHLESMNIFNRKSLEKFVIREILIIELREIKG